MSGDKCKCDTCCQNNKTDGENKREIVLDFGKPHVSGFYTVFRVLSSSSSVDGKKYLLPVSLIFVKREGNIMCIGKNMVYEEVEWDENWLWERIEVVEVE